MVEYARCPEESKYPHLWDRLESAVFFSEVKGGKILSYIDGKMKYRDISEIWPWGNK